MKYLLDTNAVIRISQRHAVFERRMRGMDPDDCGLSAIVRHELYFGAFKSRNMAENLERIAEMNFEIVPFDDEDARHAGENAASLRIAGTPIGPYDVLIAGQALARNLTLVTHNTREFSRVAGLQIEDWEV